MLRWLLRPSRLSDHQQSHQVGMIMLLLLLCQAAGSVSAAPAAAAASGAAVPPIVVAVTGSKGSGKSAFARLLTNSLLNSCGAVAFVDLDPGQPELTPPVCILFTHPL